MAIAARMPMTMMTMRSSMRVNPLVCALSLHSMVSPSAGCLLAIFTQLSAAREARSRTPV